MGSRSKASLRTTLMRIELDLEILGVCNDARSPPQAADKAIEDGPRLGLPLSKAAQTMASSRRRPWRSGNSAS